jgi:hypothetical protein
MHQIKMEGPWTRHGYGSTCICLFTSHGILKFYQEGCVSRDFAWLICQVSRPPLMHAISPDPLTEA